MVDYYAGWSIAQLQAELVTAQNRQARGNLIGIEASGVRTRKEFKSELEVSIIIQRIRWSLYLRASQKALTLAGPIAAAALVAQFPNPYAEKVKSTSARYALP